ncbi:MAG TPA: hypothetical protein V6D20_21500, partial [Candidatus Obscuribacterales bacterium]
MSSSKASTSSKKSKKGTKQRQPTEENADVTAAVVLGSTGAVGRRVVHHLALDDKIDRVAYVSRKKLESP